MQPAGAEMNVLSSDRGRAQLRWTMAGASGTAPQTLEELMPVRIRAALMAALALCLAAPAAAAANSITTGKAESYGHDSSNLYASAETSCDGKISFQWGTS